MSQLEIANDAIEAGVKLWPAFDPFTNHYYAATRWLGLKTIRAHAMFISQMAHECTGFTRMTENLNYSRDRLITIWPGRFRIGTSTEKIDSQGKLHDGKYSARLVSGQPEKIANIVYANRNGNGNRESGDGWKYRGRGPTMLTFLDNYARFQNDCGSMPELEDKGDWLEDPDILLDPEVGIWSAAWYWKDKKIVSYADQGAIKGVTRRINGGLIGVEDRAKKYDAMLKQMGSFK